MCRRYALTSPPAVVRDHFGYIETPDFPPRENIRPNEPIAVVTSRPFTGATERHFLLVRWGFIPSFVEDVENFPLIVNARAEGIAEKASFSAAFKRRRCLIPADGFYLGKSPPLRGPDGGPLALAGLYETYIDRNGSEIDTACLITVEADASCAQFASRMPAVVACADFFKWLDHENTPLDAAIALLVGTKTIR